MQKKIIFLILSSFLLISCSKEKSNLNFKKKEASKEVASKVISSSTFVEKNTPIESENKLNLLINNSESNLISESNQKKNSPMIDVSLVPIKFSLKYKNGGGLNQIAVFLDINQDFSKQFIENISKIQNSTINVFLINGDQSIIEKIYCSDDQKQSLDSYFNGLKIGNDDRNCNKEGLEYSQKYYQDVLNNDQLPIVIFSDGNLVVNAKNADYELINQYISVK